MDGQRQGPAKRWHKNGQLSWEGSYLQNREHGESRHYDAQGQLTRVEHYQQGKKVGEQQTFYANSSQLQHLERFDNQGRLVFEQKFAVGGSKTMEFSARFVKDKQILDRQYFKEGKLSSRMQQDMTRVWTLFQKFDASGVVIEREEKLKGKREGLTLQSYQGIWDDEPYIETSYYKEGKLHGAYEKKLVSGKLLEQGEYANDKKVGTWTYLDARNRSTEAYDSQGRLHGEVKKSRCMMVNCCNWHITGTGSLKANTRPTMKKASCKPKEIIVRTNGMASGSTRSPMKPKCPSGKESTITAKKSALGWPTLQQVMNWGGSSMTPRGRNKAAFTISPKTAY